jgi:hypothetical protein
MRNWLVTYALACAGAVGVVLAALWVLGAFEGLGLGPEGTIALIGGVVLTCVAGIGLMGLVFASDRSQKDDEVFRGGQSRTDAEEEKAHASR